MNREKQLIKNTGILAIGRLSSKFFTFLLLPLCTSYLVPEDYGTVDLVQTMIFLAVSIATLQIECAVFRFLIDSRENPVESTECISIGCFVYLLSTLVFTAGILLINNFYPIPYLILFILSLYSLSFAVLMQNIARGLGKMVTYSLSSFLTTIVSLLTNIVLICIFRVGAKSILWALIVSNFLGGCFIVLKENIWKYIRFNEMRAIRLKEMLKYALPLIPDNISWWITNLSDRLIISIYIGAFSNGLYAAADKIPTIYATIFSVYNLAWEESVSLAIRDEKASDYINKILVRSYKFFACLILGMICCMSFMFDLLIGKNYADAYIHVGILLIGAYFNSICSMLGNVLAGFKDSNAISYTTMVGALVNILINLLLIKTLGLLAASLSTLASYLVIAVVRYWACLKHIRLLLPLSFCTQFLAMTWIVLYAYLSQNILFNVLSLGILVIWGCYHNKEIIFSLYTQMLSKLGFGH